MRAASVRIDAVAKANVRGIVLRDDALAGIDQIFGVCFGEAFGQFFVVFKVLKISFEVQRYEPIFRLHLCATPF